MHPAIHPTIRPAVRPAVVVLACTVLALTTAGLGLLLVFQGFAPWNGIAICLIILALATGCTGGTYLHRHTSPGGDPFP